MVSLYFHRHLHCCVFFFFFFPLKSCEPLAGAKIISFGLSARLGDAGFPFLLGLYGGLRGEQDPMSLGVDVFAPGAEPQQLPWWHWCCCRSICFRGRVASRSWSREPGTPALISSPFGSEK